MDISALKKVKALFLDMDGVLWTDKKEIGNLHEIFESIRESGLKVFFGSNNATRTPLEYCEKLASFGVSVQPEQFFTSGIATVYQLRKEFPDGPRVYVFGSASLKELLRENGFDVVNENADVVLASLDREINYEKISRAMIEICEHGAKFYATNTDSTFVTENGWRPGGGVMVNCVETCTGVKPFVIGKPNTVMIEMACRANGLQPDEIMAVGDRFETDILGGIRYGAKTGLVLSGYETRETIPFLEQQPDLICENLAELVKTLRSL
ncbi:MAG: HAD-IIA family hydrolase [Anaerolineaceae bacterium]|nr:HAD-IIA family hydrolase [Anaerolineaceae bacterium]